MYGISKLIIENNKASNKNIMSFCNSNAPIMINCKDGQAHKDKYLDSSTKINSKEMLMCSIIKKILSQRKHHVKNDSSGTHYRKAINNVKVRKIGQTPRSMPQGKKCWYPVICQGTRSTMYARKSLVLRNTHVKYHSS